MQRSILVLVCVVAFSLLVNAAQPQNHGLTSTFTAQEASTLKSFLQTKADKLDSIHDAFFTIKALALLDTKPTAAKNTELCTLAKNTLKDQKVLNNLDARSIYHAAAVAEQLGCDVTVEKAVTDAIKNIIEEGDSVPHYYHAVMAALALRSQTKKEVSDDELTSVMSKISDLTESDGTIRSSTSDKEGNLYNTGLSLQLFAKLMKLTLSEQDKEHVEELVSKVETILDLANEGDNTLSFSADDGTHSPLATTSEIVRGFQQLAQAHKKALDITPIQTAHLGEYFLHHRFVSTAEDAYYFLSGLKAVQQSPKAPLALTIERSSILATAKGAEGSIKVKVADIFDTNVPSKIYLVKAHAVGKPDTILLANQEVTEALNFLAAKPEQGFYNLEFRAVPADTKYATIDSASRRVKVIGSVSVTDFELTVTDSKEGRADGAAHKAEYPNKVEGIQVLPSQHIHAQFKVRNAGGSTTRPLVAQQAFLRFTNAKTGHEAVFVATPNENKVYSVVISIDEAGKSQFRSQYGEYSLTIVVGDAFIQNPVSWTVSNSIQIVAPASAAKEVAAASAPLAAKPVIEHKFRVPEKRPPVLISTVFTFAALAPILFLLSGFLGLGANIRNFPTGADFLSAVGFIGTIGAILALIAFYWLQLNLIQTLGYLGILSIPAVFFGNRALSALSRKEKQA